MATNPDYIVVQAHDRLEELFRRQEELQRVIAPQRGFPSEDPNVLSAQIREQAFSLMMELSEAIECTAWKPWLTTVPEPVIHRDKFKGEMVDLLHFFINLCLLGGLSPDDIYTGYLAKNIVNHQRQLDGYDGRTGKCARCHSDFKDPGVQCTPDWCMVYGQSQKYTCPGCKVPYADPEAMCDTSGTGHTSEGARMFWCRSTKGWYLPTGQLVLK